MHQCAGILLFSMSPPSTISLWIFLGKPSCHTTSNAFSGVKGLSTGISLAVAGPRPATDRQSESKRVTETHIQNKRRKWDRVRSVLPRLRMTHWGSSRLQIEAKFIANRRFRRLTSVELAAASQTSVTLPLKIYYLFQQRIWLLCIR